ncbi:MAG TPA: winged helix-turn-helix domain-containing protein [Terriglobales bacterium]|nr:winged helix-turn-helix domain-containing protein [Terriglobales bacterium]
MIVVPASVYKFGEFELDPSRFELRRDNRPLKLERLPMELLVLLLERDGQVVNRQEIIERLWGKDVFLDTEHGINTAIRKIRTALREDMERPRFIQTVSGKGYRFVPEATKADGNGNATVVTERIPSPSAVVSPANAGPVPVKISGRSGLMWIGLAIGLLLLAVFLLALNVAGLRDRVFARNQIGPIHSIAVLPLANFSGDSSQDYFADGMTDELITALARNRSLRVVSRTSAMQYKGVNKPLRDIAQALGVDGILEGSVARSGGRVHVNLQLIYAPTDTHVWAESYDRDASAALSLPDELSQTIATQARTAPPAIRTARYVSPEAHDAYLQGRFYWFVQDYDRGKPYFEKAIKLQPDYAAAWSGLGDTYAADAVNGELLPSRAFAEAETDVRKALVLDDSLPEAHNALAAIYLFNKWDWKKAEGESLRSIDLDPNFAEGHHLHSYTLWVQNRDAEALREQKLSTGLDSLTRPFALGEAYIYCRQFDMAIKELQASAEFRRDFWTEFYLSQSYEFKGMDREAAEHMAQAYANINDEKSAATIRLAFKEKGFRGVSEWMLNGQLQQVGKKYVSPWVLAWDYALLKRKKETLAALNNAYNQRSPWIIFVQKEPVFDFLHSDQRYRALVKKIGLPPAY